MSLLQIFIENVSFLLIKYSRRSDFSAVIQVVVEFDLQIDLFDLDPIDLVGLGVLVEDVDVSYRAVLAVEVFLQTFYAHLHLRVQRIILHYLLRPLFYNPAALPDNETEG